MFLDEDPSGQRLGRVRGLHRDRYLEKNRPSVKFWRHEMHCRAGDRDAVFKGLPLRIGSGKRRQ